MPYGVGTAGSRALGSALDPRSSIDYRHCYRRGGKKDQVADEQGGDDTGKDHTGRYRPLKN